MLAEGALDCGMIRKSQGRLWTLLCCSETPEPGGKKDDGGHREDYPAELCKLGVNTEAMLFQ